MLTTISSISADTSLVREFAVTFCLLLAQYLLVEIRAGISKASGPIFKRAYLMGLVISDSYPVNQWHLRARSIQSDDITTKIKSDVKSITSTGNPVSEIHFFCSTDVPIALRHKLKKWAREEHGIYLEIYDGQAIAELLSDRDIFWIAERYLDIPAEIYPPAPDGSGTKWYDDLWQTWKEREQPPHNYNDFSEIKAAVRHATFRENIKQDLPIWIKLLDTLRDTTNWLHLKRRCTYEIAVARLRGQGSLHGFENDLREYFSAVPQLTDSSDIEDAAVLLIYCATASKVGKAALTIDEIERWRQLVIERTENELASANLPGRRCALLHIKGFIHSTPWTSNPNEFSLDEAIICWQEIISLVEKAPLFPLERLADFFTNLIELGLEHPMLASLIQKVDERLASRHGDSAIAERCRDRAMAYYKREEILKAIDQVHNAKLKWFTEETLKGSLLASLFLSKLYEQLGLYFASKHYAFVTAYIALHTSDDRLKYFLSLGLVAAAEADYMLGASCAFLHLTEIGLKAFFWFSKEKDPSDFNEFNRSLFHVTTLRAITDVVAPEFVEYIDAKIKLWDIEEYIGDLQPLAKEAWHRKTPEEIYQSFEEQGAGVPWSDVGGERIIRFAALGIDWTIRWNNSYATTPEAESFLATFQIILAALGGVDLCLLQAEVDVALEFVPEWSIQFGPIPSNKRIMWHLKLPSSETQPSKEDEGISPEQIIIMAVVAILGQVSTLTRSDFSKTVQHILEAGIFDKVFFGAHYVTAYQEFIERNNFEAGLRPNHARLLPDSVKPKTHLQLAWFDGPGPYYSKEESEEAIRRRYEKSILPIRYTLRRLLKDSSFKVVAKKLRGEGWKDWHLLMAIANVAINFRARVLMKDIPRSPTLTEENAIFLRLMHQEENESSELVPLAEFSEENLRMLLNIAMITSLRQMGHDIHLLTPNFGAISDFLGRRY